MPRSWLGTANAVLVSRTVTFPYSRAIWTSLFLFQNSVVSRTDVRGIIHKQISFLWLVVNDVSFSYGSSFTPLGWRWHPSGWCCLCLSPLQNRSAIQSSARDMTGYFLFSLHKMSCTVFLEVATDFSWEHYIQACFSSWHCYVFWLCHHSYFCYQIATKHCKNLRKIPEAFHKLLTMISDK